MQEVVRKEKLALKTNMECANEHLAKLQDEHTNVLNTKAAIEQDKLALCKDKSILEQQVAAITAEQLVHVLTLQDNISELEQASHEHKLHSAEENAQVLSLTKRGIPFGCNNR